MDTAARSILLKKMSINGFSIEDNGSRITLRPRGAEGTAALTIEEVSPDIWKVVNTEGKYRGYERGIKRKYFEDNLNRWVIEARLQAPG